MAAGDSSDAGMGWGGEGPGGEPGESPSEAAAASNAANMGANTTGFLSYDDPHADWSSPASGFMDYGSYFETDWDVSASTGLEGFDLASYYALQTISDFAGPLSGILGGMVGGPAGAALGSGVGNILSSLHQGKSLSATLADSLLSSLGSGFGRGIGGIAGKGLSNVGSHVGRSLGKSLASWASSQPTTARGKSSVGPGIGGYGKADSAKVLSQNALGRLYKSWG